MSGRPTALGMLLVGPLLLSVSFFEAAEALTPTQSSRSRGSGTISAKHREFMDIVAYIIDRNEKRIFGSLTTEWQRKRFIEAFWKRRDPILVTPENEFHIEHMRRWQYVNDVLARDTPMPGWRTDRGRVYLVNGPPFRVHRYPNTQQLWPLEVWEYRDSPRPGMPSFYQIIFFKPRVFNEWRLYSPTVDGPEALLIATPASMSQIDLPRIASKFPIVFSAAQRVAPGYGALGSEAVIARTMAPPPPPRPLGLYYTPEGNVDVAFLSAGPIQLHIQAIGFAHPELEGYLDIAIEVPASETTFVQVDDHYVANYEVELEIETDGAGTWRDTKRQLVARIPKDEFEQVRNLPILFRERVWVLPGSYRVRGLLTEVATHRVGAANAVASVPSLAELVVGSPSLFYVTEDLRAGGDRGDWRPFIPWVGERLRRGYPVGCVVRVLQKGDEAADGLAAPPQNLEIEYRLLRSGSVVWSDHWSGQPAPRLDGSSWSVARTLHLEELPVGKYELQVIARLGGSDGAPPTELGLAGRRSIELVDEFLPLARLLPARSAQEGMASAHHRIGQQFLRRNDFASAREHFERAVRLEPQNPIFQIDAAKTLLLAGELSVAEFLLEGATTRAPDNQEGWATLGLLRIQQGNFPGAIDAYQQSLDVAPGTAVVYNGLAEAYLSIGETPRALEMLELSLQINPEQEQVRQLRDRLRRGDGG